MALIKFTCRAAASITMFEKDARPILNMLGKDPKKGVITAAEAAQAAKTIEDHVKKLKELEKMTTIERVRLEMKNPQKMANNADKEKDDGGPRVNFAARSYPLLQMLKAAAREEKNVMWGI